MSILEQGTNVEFQNRLNLHTEKVQSLIEIGDDFEQLIVVGFTNRTGTGSLATSLGRADGVTRHIQPFKALARKEEQLLGHDPSTPLQFEGSGICTSVRLDGNPIQLIKETIGPDVDKPSEWLDTFQILENVGIKPEQLSFIPTFRNPIDAALSWLNMWEFNLQEFPFDSFNFSHQFVLGKMNELAQKGVKIAPYIHEDVKDFGADKVISCISNKVGLTFNTDMTRWGDRDAYWEGDIRKYDIPPDEWINGSNGTSSGGRGALVWRPVKTNLSQDEINFIISQINPSIEIFNHVREEFGLK